MKHFRDSDNMFLYNQDAEVASVLQAISEFASTPNWEQTHRILKQRSQLLLSDTALSLVRVMIADFEANHDLQEAENWRQHLDLLEAARKDGINKAWKHFMTRQYAAAVAHDAFVRAASSEELYNVLHQQHPLLLTDAAMVMLRQTIAQEKAAHNHATVAHLNRLLTLLSDARQYGVDNAWRRFNRSKH